MMESHFGWPKGSKRFRRDGAFAHNFNRTTGLHASSETRMNWSATVSSEQCYSADFLSVRVRFSLFSGAATFFVTASASFLKKVEMSFSAARCAYSMAVVWPFESTPTLGSFKISSAKEARDFSSLGTEQIWVRAFDGMDWSIWRPFTLIDSLV